MRIRLELLTCVVILLISGFLPIVVAEVHVQGLAPPGYNTYRVATVGGPRTLDPHWAYDTDSCGLILNVYETLIEQNKGSVDSFNPELADSWTISPDGLTYTFHIRTGVTFRNGDPLTPADVEYSFERAMVRDVSGGPNWMLYMPVAGYFGSRYYPGIDTDAGKIALGHIIDNAFTSNSTHVQIHLLIPQGFFTQILAQTWGSIMSKTWMTRSHYFPGGATDSFDWDGTWGANGHEWWIFNDYYRETTEGYFNSKVSPVDNPPQMIGTGPFQFVEWVPGEGGHLTLIRNPGYWGEWPAANEELTGTYLGYDRNHDGEIDKVEAFNQADPVDSLWNVSAITPGTTFRIFDWKDQNVNGKFDGGDLVYWGRTIIDAVWYPVVLVVGTGSYWTLVVTKQKSPRYGHYTPSRGYINTFIEYQISDWASRKSGFLAGDYDSVYVPRVLVADVWQQPGIRCKYPMESLCVDALFFNFNVGDGISGRSPFVGTETWGTGLPLYAFSNLNLRKAFIYSFNQTEFLAVKFLYEAFQVATPIILGLAPFTREEMIAYHIANRKNIDLTNAEYYFKLAWGGVDSRSGTPDAPVLPEDPTKVTPGQVWNNGFRFDMTYASGDFPGQWSGVIFASQLLAINPKFQMGCVPVEWALFAGDYLYCPWANDRSIMPLWTSGWCADYADADNFATAFMYSSGYFPFAQSYFNLNDFLIEQAAAESDPAVRRTLYEQLNDIYLWELPQIMGVVPLGRRWERDWVQGWYYNPTFGGSAASQIGESVTSNLYTIWKEILPTEDLDANGRVEIKDLSVAAKAYGSYFVGRLPPMYPPTPSTPGYPNPPWGTYTATWDSRADVNQDMKVDIKDLAKMAKLYGFQAPPWP